MTNLFSVIKQNEEQKKIKDEKDKVAINTRLARDRALKQTQEEKEREKIEKVLLSTKDAFFDATSKLENSIKGIKDNPPTEHVNSLLRLIKQSNLLLIQALTSKQKLEFKNSLVSLFGLTMLLTTR